MTWPPSGGQEEWDRLHPTLHVGQRLTGTIAWVPKPGAIGVGVDLGLPIGGFVDVLMLPDNIDDWPAIGTVTEFEIWAMDARRPQIRLKLAAPQPPLLGEALRLRTCSLPHDQDSQG